MRRRLRQNRTEILADRTGLTLVEILVSIVIFAAAAVTIASILLQQSTSVSNLIRIADRDRGIGLINRLSGDPGAVYKSSLMSGSLGTNKCLNACLTGTSTANACGGYSTCRAKDDSGNIIQEKVTLVHPFTGAVIGGYNTDGQATRFTLQGQLCNANQIAQNLCPLLHTLVVQVVCPQFASSCSQASTLTFTSTFTYDSTAGGNSGVALRLQSTTRRQTFVSSATLKCQDILGFAQCAASTAAAMVPPGTTQ